jgi:hypothetical protein
MTRTFEGAQLEKRIPSGAGMTPRKLVLAAKAGIQLQVSTSRHGSHFG